jgi:alkanesulfonate monooxygenase SsuD/methylene tetrahydromethanopterin reductase-like flavin-dependent oxidoreductase (luciferase family)
LKVFADAGVAGTPEQVVERLQAFAAVGVDRVFLLHPLHDDLDTIELLGRAVIPALAGA